jgi:ParB-like chromosome segregation protein Spo0J
MKPKYHPACAAFPDMPEKDLQDLAEDIKRNGLMEPVTLTPDGLLLDGKNRWAACEMAEAEPRTVVYAGDPVTFVLSKNKHRRHLTKSQKTMALARLANLQHGSNRFARKKEECLPETLLSVEQLAKLSGEVSRASINKGRTILRQAEPRIMKMVDDGLVSVSVTAAAVRNTNRAVQATWTAADVEREGRKVINAYPANQRRISPASPPRPKQPPRQSLAQQIVANSERWGKLRILSDEEAGRPPPEIAREEDPDFPGIDRAYAHVLKHGRVQLWSPDETKRLKLRGRFMELNAHIIALARNDYWPIGDDVDQLGDDAKRVLRIWQKHLRVARDHLSDLLAVSESDR